jgi:hypothetical protein
MVRGFVVVHNVQSKIQLSEVSVFAQGGKNLAAPWLTLGTLGVKQGTKTNSITEALNKEYPPMTLFKHSGMVLNEKYVSPDHNEIPFEFALTKNQGEELLETYTGVYIHVQVS